MGEHVAIDPPMLQGYPVGWFAPTYKYARPIWDELVYLLMPVIARSNATDMHMELITGGSIEVWSLTDSNAGRGRKYKRVVVDEAAMVPNLLDIWAGAIRPTLVDMAGDAWFLSTPKGRNGFWQLWQRGRGGDPDWASWRFPTSTNPYIAASEIEAARRTMPERIFQQEFEAEFMEDAGSVFRRVTQCMTATPQDKAQGCYIGVDWGKHEDFTVLTALGSDGREVGSDRFNQIDYAFQVGRLKAFCQRYQPRRIVAELNAMGEPLVEQLQRDGLPVVGFQTTSQSKTQAIEALALAFERGEIAILPDDVLVNELQAFEMTRLPSGAIRYAAPEGLHDDCVISLALAWHALRGVPPVLFGWA